MKTNHFKFVVNLDERGQYSATLYKNEREIVTVDENDVQSFQDSGYLGAYDSAEAWEKYFLSVGVLRKSYSFEYVN